jgi:ankyrin repeat protein
MLFKGRMPGLSAGILKMKKDCLSQKTSLDYAHELVHAEGRVVKLDDVAKLLVAAGASVSATFQDGWTLMHYASNQDHMAAAEILLAAGTVLSIVVVAGLAHL